VVVVGTVVVVVVIVVVVSVSGWVTFCVVAPLAISLRILDKSKSRFASSPPIH